jgi:putative redox protein
VTEVRLTWTGERLQFMGRTGYGVPIPIGGDPDGEGAKPSDLLPLSLAACTGYDVVEILRKQRQPLRAVEAVVSSTQDLDPPWTFRSIHTHWVLSGDVQEHKAARAIDLAESKYCSIAATLRPVVEISHSFEIVRP